EQGDCKVLDTRKRYVYMLVLTCQGLSTSCGYSHILPKTYQHLASLALNLRFCQIVGRQYEDHGFQNTFILGSSELLFGILFIQQAFKDGKYNSMNLLSEWTWSAIFKFLKETS